MSLEISWIIRDLQSLVQEQDPLDSIRDIMIM